jgi:hypothetical protein
MKQSFLQVNDGEIRLLASGLEKKTRVGTSSSFLKRIRIAALFASLLQSGLPANILYRTKIPHGRVRLCAYSL